MLYQIVMKSVSYKYHVYGSHVPHNPASVGSQSLLSKMQCCVLYALFATGSTFIDYDTIYSKIADPKLDQ